MYFKSRITHVVEKMPPYFEIGDRELIILPARLRNFCSNLNYDLFRVNLTADPSCVCRNPCENAFHFFFECPIYNMCHLEMENTMRIISIPMQTPTVKHTYQDWVTWSFFFFSSLFLFLLLSSLLCIYLLALYYK